MKPRHTAALALLGWALFLRLSPNDPDDHPEWSGHFKTKASCEKALERQKSHWYDANGGGVPVWVRGLKGCCIEDSAEVGCKSK
jgi:hypothetical protein